MALAPLVTRNGEGMASLHLQHLYYLLVCEGAVGCASLLCVYAFYHTLGWASEFYIYTCIWLSQSSIWVQVGDICQQIGAAN